ncbi:MAG: hypothetical protein OQK12_05370 [Motiliproteus sp.]|nr:hypothetical protein [Motiliproteus sp.]MCW9053832.1 hypothetical protein [Motiliproteus sp.]
MSMGYVDSQADSLIAGWEQKLAAFEIVACTERWNQLPESLIRDVKPYVPETFEPSSPALFVSFDGLMERRYTAFLIAGLEQAVLYYEKDGDLLDEFIGVMALSEFWQFLASFPNVYAHLMHNALKQRVH